MRSLLLIATVLSILTMGFFVFGAYATKHMTGSSVPVQHFEVRSGEDAYALGKRLEESGLVFSRFAFVWHLFSEEKTRKIIAGDYRLSGNLTIPEIALILTSGKTVSRDIKITFPEGWTLEKMSERLTANSLPGEEFFQVAQKPLAKWRQEYDFLADLPKEASLEGFLFPDTYFFFPEATAEEIVEAMLKNFDKKYDDSLRQAVVRSGRSFFSAITMASIIEEEGRTAEERGMISDVFWKRIAIDQPLQSDATVNYVHGTTRLQPTIKDTESLSPYNTYRYKGLPPGPISNPSLASIRASLFPVSNPYYYFLVDLNTGETFYAKTFEEHVQNRARHGL